MARRGIIGFVIQWGIIAAVVVIVLSYFGVVKIENDKVRSYTEKTKDFFSGAGSKASRGIEGTVDDAKREVRHAGESAEHAVKDAARDAGSTVREVKQGAEDTVRDIKKEAQ